VSISANSRYYTQLTYSSVHNCCRKRRSVLNAARNQVDVIIVMILILMTTVMTTPVTIKITMTLAPLL